MSDNSENPVTETTISEHPYAKRLEGNLKTQKNMLVLLESKMSLLDTTMNNMVDSTGQRFNTPEENLIIVDKKIQRIKTQGEIDVLKKVIHEKETYYKAYMVQFEKDAAEVDKKFKHTVDIAKKSTKPHVQKLLSMVIWERIEGDLEAKIALYKQLRKHV